MKKTIAAIMVATLFASAAQAETFTYNVQFEEPTFYGGMGEEGRDGRSGVMNGAYTTVTASGETASGSITCAGMDQPDNGLFDFHLSCTATRADGESKSSLIYGCNSLPEGRGASCVGGLEGRAGTLKGMRGVITMHLGAKGASVGTGQWIE
ncbi:hypothetical protein P7228_00285 [Altererythrobacter arenosus]|uniref:DUF3617 family protein n=1 Tax=Altererythrobacter arenosus TaxID=3032592 RepID=A0ABY8FRB0_9SPHN|nr:hypothetical protein [Altererythrobacter sp. CAU 1644]WFL77535.1 hypothetical protein P7228_00285 [Altererythrobacter sp. CAU 1644]